MTAAAVAPSTWRRERSSTRAGSSASLALAEARVVCAGVVRARRGARTAFTANTGVPARSDVIVLPYSQLYSVNTTELGGLQA